MTTFTFVTPNLHGEVAPRARAIMPLETQFYGMRGVAIEDPDGHIITFAERVAE